MVLSMARATDRRQHRRKRNQHRRTHKHMSFRRHRHRRGIHLTRSGWWSGWDWCGW